MVGRWPKPTRDAAVYVTENAVRVFLAGVTGILIARHLGPASFGLLSYALGIVGIAVPIASLGMRPLLTRDLSINDERQPLLAAAIRLQVVAGLALGVLSSALILATRPKAPDILLIALVLLPLPLLATGDTIRALLEATGRSQTIFRASLGASVVASLLRVVAIVTDAPLWTFALFATLESLILLLALTWGNPRFAQLRSLQSRYSSTTARTLLRNSLPLLISSIATILYMRLDITMLGLMVGDFEVGIYSAASRFSEALYFVPVAVAAGVRPRLARLHAQGETGTYNLLTQRFVTAAWASGLTGALVTALLASTLVQVLLGQEFEAAATVLVIHVFAAPFVFMGVASTQWFIDRDLTRAVLVRALIGLGTNLVLNLLLIPSYGAQGAAIGTLVAYAISVFASNIFGREARDLFKVQSRALRFAWK